MGGGGGYEDFADIFMRSSQNWISLGVISKYFRVFLKVNLQNGDIFWGCKNFKYFLGCLIFLISFWSKQ